MPYISESAMQKINLDMIADDARIAALEAELDFALNFLQRENSGECIFQRNSYVDIRLTEARALLDGGGK